jgi:hypothetical protein
MIDSSLPPVTQIWDTLWPFFTHFAWKKKQSIVFRKMPYMRIKPYKCLMISNFSDLFNNFLRNCDSYSVIRVKQLTLSLSSLSSISTLSFVYTACHLLLLFSYALPHLYLQCGHTTNGEFILKQPVSQQSMNVSDYSQTMSGHSRTKNNGSKTVPCPRHCML